MRRLLARDGDDAEAEVVVGGPVEIGQAACGAQVRGGVVLRASADIALSAPFARPKSKRTTRPFGVSFRFAGLMSRWTMGGSQACSSSSASSSWSAQPSTFSVPKGRCVSASSSARPEPPGQRRSQSAVIIAEFGQVR